MYLLFGTHEGVDTTGSSPSGTYYYGAKITVKGTVKTGYTNIGWTWAWMNEDGSWDDEKNMTTKSDFSVTYIIEDYEMKVEPFAELMTYTITYDANGGTGAPENQTKVYGEELTLSSTVPTRSGYKFVNWSGDDGKTYEEGVQYTENSNLTLTAVWIGGNQPMIEQISGSDYGDKVNYSANGVNDWKIFCKDNTNVYIIAGDVIPASSLDLADGIALSGNRVYSTNNDPAGKNVLVPWMNNQEKWAQFGNGISDGSNVQTTGAWGGPSFSQLKACLDGLGYNYNGDTYTHICNITLNYELFKCSDRWWQADTWNAALAIEANRK